MKTSFEKKDLLLLTACLMAVDAFGLSGRVLEAAGREPVPGAVVMLLEDSSSVVTGEDGVFSMDPVAVQYGRTYHHEGRPYIAGNDLIMRMDENIPVTAELFNASGVRIASRRPEMAAREEMRMDLNTLLPRGGGAFTGYIRLTAGGKISIHKITRFSRAAGWEILLSRPAPGPLFRRSAGAAAGTIRISKDRLNTADAGFEDASEDLGDIILTYPPRVLDVGAEPPYGAVVLFNGSGSRSAAQEELQSKWGPWEKVDGKDNDASGITFKVVSDPEYPGDENRWTLQSCCHANWGFDDLVAKEAHGDVQIHVEFSMLGEYDDDANPDPNTGDSQTSGSPGYTNSGVYIQNRYEIQIFSDDDRTKILDDTHSMASLVNQKSPDSDELRPNGQWQAYDVTFRTSRWDGGGNRLSHGYMTIYWNGVKVHDNVEAMAPATGVSVHSGEEMTSEIYGLKLQSEARDCRFRNIWMKHLTIDEAETDFGY